MTTPTIDLSDESWIICAWLETLFSPRPTTMALGLLALHWLLLIGWGFAQNDSAGGYQYCRLTMPSIQHTKLTPWVFSAVVLLLLLILGILDRKKLGLSFRRSYYPVPLFIMSQLLSMWLLMASTRY